jgi:hypothetical protein
MTVTDLIKKLQQCKQNETIASVRIEFGDGSIYNDPPMLKQNGFRKASLIGIGIISVLGGGFLIWSNVHHRPVIYHDYTFAHLPPCASNDPLGLHSANPCRPRAPFAATIDG